MKDDVTLEKTRHKDAETWKVSIRGQQVGFVYRGRHSWGFCNTRKGGFPMSWQSTDVKNQEEAIAKLIEWDEEARAIARSIVNARQK